MLTGLLLFAYSLLCSAAAPPLLSTLNLQKARVSAGYRHVLDSAFRRIKAWCVVHDRQQPEQLSDENQLMADMLVEHVQYLYENQFGVASGRQAILSVQTKYRHLRGQLTKAWDSVKSWESIAPVNLRVPIPFLIF